MGPVRLFGREPAVILAFVAGMISLVSALVVPLSPLQQAALNGAAFAIAGLVTAWIVRSDRLLPAVVGLAEAGFAVALAFGVEVSAEVQSAVVGFVGVAFAMFVRTQVTAPFGPNGEPRVAEVALSSRS